jgi:uncharacterized protein (DUF1697 family)
MQYVALLRGINVGGNNIIRMADLKDAFEKMGFQSVSTFIQSGNVLFEATKTDGRALEGQIEKALQKQFHYSARVLVRSQKEMENTVKHFPKRFADGTWKHNVIFLSDTIDVKDFLEKCQLKSGIEEAGYAQGVLFWSAKLDTITRSNMLKLSSRPEYQGMTVRNVNTTKKILQLMNL